VRLNIKNREAHLLADELSKLQRAHSITDGYTESCQQLGSSALIFDEAQTITANAALARSRGGK
jgi:hypothetical protein